MKGKKRFRNYQQAGYKTKPIENNSAVSSSSNDNRIDQDFPGYPHGQAKEEIIKPETQNDLKTADVENKDGEKRESKSAENYDEASSDGSASAFDATEEVKE